MLRRLPAMVVLSALTLLAAGTMPVPATAAEITLLAGTSMRVLLPDLLSQFERSSGHKVKVEYGTLGVNAERVMKGEGDVAVVTDAQNKKLEKQGKLLAGSRIEWASVGYGLLVQTGSAKPDIGTVDALKRTLTATKSIGVGDPAGGGPVGLYTASLIKRMGIADAVKDKLKVYPSGTQVADGVAKGEVQVGIGLGSDAVAVSGLSAVPLPSEVQNYTKYTLGIVAASRSVDAAKALVAFLNSPSSRQALAAHGFATQ